MGSVTPNFQAPIFEYNQPLVIASNRNTAMIYGISLRYQANGYKAGTILARNTTDGKYQAYDAGGASGIDAAIAILLDAYAPEDFTDATANGYTLANGLFGQATVYKSALTGYDSAALGDLNGKLIFVDGGIELLKF